MSYSVLNDYVKYIRTFKINPLRLGNLYVYKYLFNKAENFNEQELDKIKFYDFFPATFVFGTDIKNKTFTGINFHHMPVKSRHIWLNKVKEFIDDDKIFKDGQVHELYLLKRYEILRRILYKSQIAIRQYKFERVSELRIVPNLEWGELFNYYSRTYYGAAISEIEAKYRKYIPKRI